MNNEIKELEDQIAERRARLLTVSLEDAIILRHEIHILEAHIELAYIA